MSPLTLETDLRKPSAGTHTCSLSQHGQDLLRPWTFFTHRPRAAPPSWGSLANVTSMGSQTSCKCLGKSRKQGRPSTGRARGPPLGKSPLKWGVWSLINLPSQHECRVPYISTPRAGSYPIFLKSNNLLKNNLGMRKAAERLFDQVNFPW